MGFAEDVAAVLDEGPLRECGTGDPLKPATRQEDPPPPDVPPSLEEPIIREAKGERLIHVTRTPMERRQYERHLREKRCEIEPMTAYPLGAIVGRVLVVKCFRLPMPIRHAHHLPPADPVYWYTERLLYRS